jgi:hypothetical protein
MVQRRRGMGQVLLLLCSKTCGDWEGRVWYISIISISVSVSPSNLPPPPPLLNLETNFSASRQIHPHTMSQFIYPAYSIQASAIVCQCLLVLCVLIRELPAHISVHSTQSSANMCILFHASLLRVYQCRYYF